MRLLSFPNHFKWCSCDLMKQVTAAGLCNNCDNQGNGGRFCEQGSYCARLRVLYRTN
ncbi:hypothetical protein RND71_026516 [Anisodus tanguticus]|uniref:Uncharacterized protein n=1 Tax=Anisodus tanguticus TaxID=243964 RepID=A0AAE1V3V1_9SOLA|nr:hypothetical protein RND71_026516 [Anisodus tanguticus]